MKTDLIMELVDLAISFAKTHLEGDDLNEALLEMTYKGAEAYEDHSGKELEVVLIEEEPAF
jgi:hypothetical protein